MEQKYFRKGANSFLQELTLIKKEDKVKMIKDATPISVTIHLKTQHLSYRVQMKTVTQCQILRKLFMMLLKKNLT